MELSVIDKKRIARWNTILNTINERMTAPKIAKALKIKKDTTRIDCNELAKIGYMDVEQVKIARGHATGYLSIKNKLDMKDYQNFKKRKKLSYMKKGDVNEFVGILPNSRVIRLIDSVRWTPKAKQSRCARTGSTLGTMTF